MDDPIGKFESFFKDEDLALIVDTICKRYKKLPHEILQETTIFEFSFDVAILCMALDYETEQRKGVKKGKKAEWGKFGIERTVADLKKEDAEKAEDK